MVVFLTMLSGCASIRVFDMPKVQNELSTAYQNAENVVQKANTDYNEKKSMIARLAKIHAAGFQDAQAELNQKMSVMKNDLDEMTAEKRKMSEANSQIVALGYNRTKVNSTDPQYDRIDQAVQQFESAAKLLNASSADYTANSNALSDLAAAKKLYYNFDVAEFQKRIQQNVRIAQGNQGVMEDELNRCQTLVDNWPKTRGRAEAGKLYSTMVETAQNYSMKAQHLSQLSHDMADATAGYARVSSLESNWPQVQKIINDFDRSNQELSDINALFAKQASAFKTLAGH
jgi:hypothetical protein